VFVLIGQIQEQARQQLRDDTPAPATHAPDNPSLRVEG
jgi:hypothetical protein